MRRSVWFMRPHLVGRVWFFCCWLAARVWFLSFRLPHLPEQFFCYCSWLVLFSLALPSRARNHKRERGARNHCPVRLSLLAKLVSHSVVFFSPNKLMNSTFSYGLSRARIWGAFGSWAGWPRDMRWQTFCLLLQGSYFDSSSLVLVW
jgi:hypothetical protein